MLKEKRFLLCWLVENWKWFYLVVWAVLQQLVMSLRWQQALLPHLESWFQHRAVCSVPPSSSSSPSLRVQLATPVDSTVKRENNRNVRVSQATRFPTAGGLFQVIRCLTFVGLPVGEAVAAAIDAGAVRIEVEVVATAVSADGESKRYRLMKSKNSGVCAFFRHPE